MAEPISTAVSSDTQTKRCCTCKVTKPLSDFHRYAKRPDGRAKRCKVCCRTCNARPDIKPKRQAWRRANYLANRETLLARQLAYEAEHRERKRAYDRHYQAHSPRKKEYLAENKERFAAYRKANRDKFRPYFRAYAEKNREHIREYHRKYAKANAAKLGEKSKRREAMKQGATIGNVAELRQDRAANSLLLLQTRD